MARLPIILVVVLLALIPGRAEAGGWRQVGPVESATVSGAEVRDLAAAGMTVDLKQVRVDGDVDLGGLRLQAPWRCRQCHLTGSVLASNAVFGRMFELRDSTVDAAGTFDGATFQERVDLDGTAFGGPANLSATQFQSDASLVATTFLGEADFSEAGFEKQADFSRARFTTRPGFVNAEFQADGSFRAATLESGANFDGARTTGGLAFDGAVLDGDVDFTSVAARSLSLDRVVFPAGVELSMNQVQVEELRMDPDDVRLVLGVGSRNDVLQLIEATAQHRGDLAQANDARYDRLEMLNAEGGRSARLWDTVVYRGLAGYLVRPSHPLVAFVVLVALGSLVRAGAGMARWRRLHRAGDRRRAQDRAAGARGRRTVLRLQRGVAHGLAAAAATLGVAVTRKPPPGADDPDRVGSYAAAGLRLTEFLAYKALIVVFLLCLASSNPSARKFLDTLWR